MNFSQAISSGFENYTNFRGRSVRSEYWYWSLFNVLVTVAGWIVDSSIRTSLVSALVGLALFLPGLAVTFRRLHDTDHSGWWIWISLIPIIGFIVLLIFLTQAGDREPNRYGLPSA